VTVFTDRADAGSRLADRLGHLAGSAPVVVALPRGGIPVGLEIAQRLGAPLDVVVVRKIGAPQQPELALGAVGEGGTRVLNDELVASLGISPDLLDALTDRARLEVTDRASRLRGDLPQADLSGRVVVLVDDGMATGATARAALQVLRAHGVARIVLAMPVADPDVAHRVGALADEVVCIEQPSALFAVGAWYRDFTQVSDEEARRMLALGARARHVDADVVIETDGRRLPGRLVVPSGAVGVVVFAHGSGSSRLSPRNVAVAQRLHAERLGTLLFDLLEPVEAQDRGNVFDVPLLARRLLAAAAWVRTHPESEALPLGYFGASTGAAAALWAAAERPDEVRAVVSRGGRPDLAGDRLRRVSAPTLLIVGGADDVVLGLNEQAARLLAAEHRLEVVPQATHLFDEPGALERVADLAAGWFAEHLS
jgi:predicted phosphoribosyltransferase/predicted alpha/beta-hydrolase family hydrolase